MADRSDEPAMVTLGQLRELSDEEGHGAMCDTIGRAASGAEVLLPLPDDTRVRYVWDGREFLHRADTRAAEVLRRSADRMVAKHG